MAMTLAPFLAASSSPVSFSAGLKKVISVWPLRRRLSSVSVGTRTLATMSASFQSAAAVLAISTPAAS